MFYFNFWGPIVEQKKLTLILLAHKFPKHNIISIEQNYLLYKLTH